jgi:hypothetical protein
VTKSRFDDIQRLAEDSSIPVNDAVCIGAKVSASGRSLLPPSLGCRGVLKMEAENSSKTLVAIYKSAWLRIPD